MGWKPKILSIGGLHLTFVKMGIYGGICANMAEYVQKIAKLCKPGAKTGGMGGITLYVLYIFLPSNSRYLTTRRNGGMKNRGLPLTFVKMCIYGGIWANMAVYGQKIAKKGKPGAKLAVWGGIFLFVSYRFLPQNLGF